MFETKAKKRSPDGLGNYPRSTDGPLFSYSATGYSATADDSKSGKSSREATMLFTVAEGHLKDGMAKECLESAEKALALFKSEGDDVGTADTLSIIISALCMSSPQEASVKAESEKSAFAAKGCKRGEACMMLALAEITASMAGGAPELEKALTSASEALSVFQDLGDKKMEASAYLVLGTIYSGQANAADVLDSASKATAKFKEVGDFAGQAKALHLTASASVITEDFLTAVKTSAKAKTNYSELGDKRSAAAECEFMAKCFLAASMPHKALVAAREAMTLRKGLSGKTGEEISLFLICSALAEGGRKSTALKTAEEGLAKIKKSGDKKAEAIALETMMYALVANEKAPEGVTYGDQAVDIAKKELNDPMLELRLLNSIAQVWIKVGDEEEAVATLNALATRAAVLDKDKEAADAKLASGYLRAAACSVADDEKFEAKFEEAVSLAGAAGGVYKDSGLMSGQASALVLEAKVKSTRPDAEAATVTSLLTQASDLYEEVGDLEGQAETMSLLAASSMYPEGYGEAMSYASTAAELLGKLGKKAAQAQAMYDMANVSVLQGDGEEAMATIATARELAKSAGAKGVEAKLLMLLSQAYINDMQEYEIMSDDLPPEFVEMRAKAMKAVKEAAVLAGQTGEHAQAAAALYWKGQVLLASFRGLEASEAAAEAEALFEKVSDAKGQVNSLLLSANINKYLGNKPVAKAKAEAAMELAKSDSWSEGVEAAKALLATMKEKKVKGKKGKKPKKKKGGKKTKMVKQMVKKGGGGGGKGLELVPAKNKIMELVKNVLTEDDGAEADTPFMEAGIDSLGSVQLVTDVSKEFRMSLAPSVVFDFPTVKALAEHLVAESGGGGGGGGGDEEWVEEWVEVEVDDSDDDDDEDYKPRKKKGKKKKGKKTQMVKKMVNKGGGGGGGGLQLAPSQAKVIELVKNVLTEDDNAEADTPFMEAGIDSLGSVQLVTDISKEFRMQLAPSVVFDFPTAKALAQHLVDESGGGGGGGGGDNWVEEWVEEAIDDDDDDDDDSDDDSDDDDDESEDDEPKPKKTKAIAAASAAAVGSAPAGLDMVPTLNKVIEMVKAVIADEDEVSADAPFMEAGIDSLGSVQLVTDVSKEFKMQLAPSVVFDYPSAKALAEHLVAESLG